MIDAPLCRALTSSWNLRAAPAALLAATLLLGAQGASAEPLVINANTSNPGPRAAWEAAIDAFQAEHPEIDVSFNVYDHESYKKSIRNWLTSASPDVVYWFVGNRMKQFVVPGLLEDVSDLFTPEVRQQMTAGRARSRHGRRPAVRCPLHLLPYRRLLPA